MPAIFKSTFLTKISQTNDSDNVRDNICLRPTAGHQQNMLAALTCLPLSHSRHSLHHKHVFVYVPKMPLLLLLLKNACKKLYKKLCHFIIVIKLSWVYFNVVCFQVFNVPTKFLPSPLQALCTSQLSYCTAEAGMLSNCCVKFFLLPKFNCFKAHSTFMKNKFFN